MWQVPYGELVAWNPHVHKRLWSRSLTFSLVVSTRRVWRSYGPHRLQNRRYDPRWWTIQSFNLSHAEGRYVFEQCLKKIWSHSISIWVELIQVISCRLLPGSISLHDMRHGLLPFGNHPGPSVCFPRWRKARSYRIWCRIYLSPCRIKKGTKGWSKSRIASVGFHEDFHSSVIAGCDHSNSISTVIVWTISSSKR